VKFYYQYLVSTIVTLVILVTYSTIVNAQAKPSANKQHGASATNTYLNYTIDADGDTINIVDNNNLKQGKWIITGKPDFLGFSNKQIGRYINNQMQGTWYTYIGGDIVSVENYKNNALNGECKYFEHGILTCTGTYRGLNSATAFDTILVHNPATDKDTLVAVQNENSTLKHGLWTYFDAESGNIIGEQEFYLDEPLPPNTKPLNKADSTKLQNYYGNLPHNSGKYYAPMQSKKQPKPVRFSDIPLNAQGILPNKR
jgi:antitoxin component YwqK of YwqJK toxin-antitoxin module